MLGEAGLKVKREKCKFGKAYLEYLGHMVGGGKVAVPWNNFKHINSPLPRRKCMPSYN